MQNTRISAFRWCVTTLSGQRLPLGKVRTPTLTTTLAQVEELFGPGSVQYDKAYRGLRKFGAYVQVLELPPMFGEKLSQTVVLTVAPAIER